ncbi:MAG: hypothetical protein WBJ10_15055 [Daejeonella sp.]|uniref:hypothetical protein n=1 Tax=Daejeonella sp. TaxID=2805397 RepID=UPI003C70B950
MEKYFKSGYSIVVIILFLAGIMSFAYRSIPDNSVINGAWKMKHGSVEQVLIFNNGYFMHTTFDKSQKLLIQTRGGAYKYSDDQLHAKIEFNSKNKEEIGQTIKSSFYIIDNRLASDVNGKKSNWTMVDNGKGPMVGTWRSAGRMQDGKVVLSPPRARKTFKILSGSRFQWAAINAETTEFFGTGGGSYTYENGKYTETLDFFTKDSTKVGNSITFDGKVEGDLWHHSGLSSQGAKMYEIWKMEPKL